MLLKLITTLLKLITLDTIADSSLDLNDMSTLWLPKEAWFLVLEQLCTSLTLRNTGRCTLFLRHTKLAEFNAETQFKVIKYSGQGGVRGS